MFIDIETYSPDTFPDIINANHTVNVITIYDSLSDKFITWGLKEYNNTQDDVTYVKCEDEKDLFKAFIQHLELDYPDILSGWNSEFFVRSEMCRQFFFSRKSTTTANLSSFSTANGKETLCHALCVQRHQVA